MSEWVRISDKPQVWVRRGDVVAVEQVVGAAGISSSVTVAAVGNFQRLIEFASDVGADVVMQRLQGEGGPYR